MSLLRMVSKCDPKTWGEMVGMILIIPWTLSCHCMTGKRPIRSGMLNFIKKQYVLKDFLCTPWFHHSRIDSPDTNSSILSQNSTTFVKRELPLNAELLIVLTVEGIEISCSDVHSPINANSFISSSRPLSKIQSYHACIDKMQIPESPWWLRE